VIVDPAYATEQYLEDAKRRHARIVRVLETHNHADHVSGHGRLALGHRVPVAIHPAAEPEYPFEALEDGEQVEVGSVCLRVLHTPGHRPEHCCFAVIDRSRGDEPWLVLTGDSLLVGDAARPDLAVEAREGAEGLFQSLQRLTELSDGVEVYPGHVAGSLCGTGMSSKSSSTIGFERRFNPALRFGAVEDFVADSAMKQSPRPPNMERIVALNRGPFVGEPPELAPVRAPDGATVLDVRPVADFAAGHVPGALNVPVSGSSFATRAGFILDPEERIVLHASDEEEAERAARGLRSVGFLELAGFVTSADATERSEPVELDELERLLDEGSVQVLDVREKSERDEGYIPGSLHIPYRLLRETGADGLDTSKPVVTICGSGTRASIAASVLAATGVDARPVLDGGVDDWPGQTVSFRRCGGA
jgi:glyoxylase-like metal-dependent hydrolase (beta-lactamase superfamily II)/rhodanese-related sulfurtransferase